jgi:hypothetical protein
MRKSIIILLLFLISSLYSQNQANNWVFTYKNALTFNKSVTCPDPPCLFEGTNIETDEGFSSISDSNGNLLFYTNAIEVWNYQNNLLINGTGLFGHWNSAQSSLIIPKPSCTDTFYIFTVDGVGLYNRCKSKGFNYSKVILNEEIPEGIVVEKNINLLENCTEKLTGVRNKSCNSIWVIIHEWESNAFRSYLVSENGISTPVISKVGSVHKNNQKWDDCYNKLGFMKVSPFGNKLALTVKFDAFVELFDFNNKTGEISNCIHIKDDVFNIIQAIEFSPNGKYLYIYNGYYTNPTYEYMGLYQYDISKNTGSEIFSSRIKINDLSRTEGNILLGPDGKLYISYWNDNRIDVIENPNKKCPECNYRENILTLYNSTKGGFPNFISSYFAENNVSLPDTIIKIGSEVNLPLNININCVCENDDPGYDYSAEIQFDASYFYPYDNPIITENKVIDGQRILTLEGTFKPESQEAVVTEIHGLVLLGNGTKTPLKINRFEILNSDINVKTEDGSLEIYGVCQPEMSRVTLFEPLYFDIIPNPVEESLNFRFRYLLESDISISIVNCMGNIVKKYQTKLSNEREIELDVSDLASGIYFTTVKAGGQTQTEKFVILK